MAFVTATSRNTGDLITSGIWNQDVVDNPNFLKGLAGQIVFEDGASFAGAVVPIADNTHDLGSDSLRWGEILAAERLQVGGYRVANRREERLTWEDDLTGTPQNDVTTTASGSALAGGSGQAVLEVNNDSVGTARVDQRPLQNGAAVNLWTPAKNPYYRIELHVSSSPNDVDIFVGLRATLGAVAPGSSEDHVGFRLGAVVGEWRATSSDGTGVELTDINTQITDGARHILEFYQQASKIEFWVDGVLLATHTTEFPDTTMSWQILIVTAGTGGATQTFLTVGQQIIQEDVP